MKLKPFLEVIDGNVLSLGQVRTRKKGIVRLLELMRSPTAMLRFALLHTNTEQEARWNLDQLALELPTTPVVANATTAIGAHVGPNGLGFVAFF